MRRREVNGDPAHQRGNPQADLAEHRGCPPAALARESTAGPATVEPTARCPAPRSGGTRVPPATRVARAPCIARGSVQGVVSRVSCPGPGLLGRGAGTGETGRGEGDARGKHRREREGREGRGGGGRGGGVREHAVVKPAGGRVRLVRGEGRGVSDQYGVSDAARPLSTKGGGRRGGLHGRGARWEEPRRPAPSRIIPGAQPRRGTPALPPPSPPLLPAVLTGHVSSLPPY